MPFDKENIKGLIWDLDNTLYRFDDVFKEACNRAVALAAIKQDAPLTLQQAVDIGWQSYEEYGYSGRLFIERFNLCRKTMHFDFHESIDETIIEKSVETVDLFQALDLEHFLITHASREWAIRTTAHLGLSPWLNEDNILAHEDTGFESKAESRVPFERALDYLRLPAENVLMIEDTAANLKVPAEMGMGTALIHHGRKPEELPACIDLDFDNAPALLRWLQKS